MAEIDPNAARCTACGAAFHCGAADVEPCWCTRFPALPTDRLAPDAGCLCAACLGLRLKSAGASVAAER